MKQSETIGNLATALAAAHSAFGDIKRDKTVRVKTRTGGEYEFSYAPMENLLAATRKQLAEQGLVVAQSVIVDDSGREQLETLLLHASGEWMANLTPVIVTDHSAQAYGSAVTYARRYGYTQMFNLASDEDDDGNAAQGNAAERIARGAKGRGKAAGGQEAGGQEAGPKGYVWENGPSKADALVDAALREVLRKRIADLGADERALLGYIKAESVDLLTAEKYRAAMAALDAKEEKARKQKAVQEAKAKAQADAAALPSGGEEVAHEVA